MAGDTDPAGEPVSLERKRVKAALRKQLFAKEDEPVKIGRFVVTERLGAGGMGVVYAAYDPKLKREVAIKLVRFGAEDVDQRLRLEREAQAMARLDHPNVLPVYEVGEHDGQVFVAMQLVRGETLRVWVEGKTWTGVVAMYVQAGHGLLAAHEAGLVHRDFKPENVLVGEDGRARVMDFGLAHPSRDPVTTSTTAAEPSSMDTPLTRTGSLVVTPAYMAPEQFTGESTDARTDQFAFCVALWEALFGARPFGADTLAELQEAVCDGVRPNAPRGSVPVRVTSALVRGLARVPDERFPSMNALLEELQAPAGRRGRWIMLGAAAILGSVAFAATGREQPTVVDPCIEADTVLDQHWNEQARSEVSEALGGPMSTTGFVTERLDRYRDDWHRASASVCRGLTASPGNERLAAQRRCLDDRVVDLEAAIELLREPGSIDPWPAPNLVIELPKVTDCEDDRVLRAEARDRSFTVSAEDYEAARRAVARLRALQLAETTDLARYQRAADAVGLARQTGDRGLAAEALHWHARARNRSGHTLAQQVEALDAATELAEASGHDRFAARSAAYAASKLVMTRGDIDADDVERRIERARLLAERSGDAVATYRVEQASLVLPIREESLQRSPYWNAYVRSETLVPLVSETLDPHHRFNAYFRTQERSEATYLGDHARAARAGEAHAETVDAFFPPATWPRCTSAIWIASDWAAAGDLAQAELWMERCDPAPVTELGDRDLGLGFPGWAPPFLERLFILGSRGVEVDHVAEPVFALLAKNESLETSIGRATPLLFERGEFGAYQRLLDASGADWSWVEHAVGLMRVRMGDCSSPRSLGSVAEAAPDLDGLAAQIVCAAERQDAANLDESLSKLAALSGTPEADVSVVVARMRVELLLGRPREVIALAERGPSPSALVQTFEGAQQRRRLLREFEGTWGLALLELGDHTSGLAKLAHSDNANARTEWDQRLRFGLARALVATNGDADRARRLALQARARWLELGPHNAGHVAEVDRWLAEHAE